MDPGNGPHNALECMLCGCNTGPMKPWHLCLAQWNRRSGAGVLVTWKVPDGKGNEVTSQSSIAQAGALLAEMFKVFGFVMSDGVIKKKDV